MSTTISKQTSASPGCGRARPVSGIEKHFPGMDVRVQSWRSRFPAGDARVRPWRSRSPCSARRT